MYVMTCCSGTGIHNFLMKSFVTWGMYFKIYPLSYFCVFFMKHTNFIQYSLISDKRRSPVRGNEMFIYCLFI